MKLSLKNEHYFWKHENRANELFLIPPGGKKRQFLTKKHKIAGKKA